MVKYHARLMAAVFIVVDVAATSLAWILAYFLRFHAELVTGILPVTKGVPELSRYLLLLPLIAVLWPAVLYFHGLYQVKRGRSHIDEFFAIVLSVVIGTVLTLGATLYVRVYYRFTPEEAPLWEYSQAVFGLFVVLDVFLLNLGRAALRRQLERMWAAGYNVRRILVAGGGELGQVVAETLLAHRELGYRVLGFVSDSALAGSRTGLPVLGRLDEASAVAEAQQADQVYVALPLEEHARMVDLIRGLSSECIDIKVVPDLVQYATHKAALEDIDGIPIISLNETPLQGWNSMVKRLMDIAVGSAILLFLTFVFPVFPVIAFFIKLRGGRGPVFFTQERVSVDGRRFRMFKFRSMVDDAEKETGPIFATSDDPRRTPVGGHPAQVQPGRAAPAVQRGAGRHEPGGSPAGAAALRAAVQGADPAVHAPPPGEERHDGLGADQRPARQHLDRGADRIRPLLHRELVAAAGHEDPDPHPVPRLRPEARLLSHAARAATSGSLHA